MSKQKELENAKEQFDQFDQQVKDLTLDALKKAPVEESESQTKLSSKEIEKSKEIYLKPTRTYPPGVNPKTGVIEKFNEKFRKDNEFVGEYVNFIAENLSIIGESITLTVKKYPGTNCEDWTIPVNVPVWAPRMVATRLTECNYTVLKMEDRPTSVGGEGTYYGQMVAKSRVQRLDARPVSSRKSVFMP